MTLANATAAPNNARPLPPSPTPPLFAFVVALTLLGAPTVTDARDTQDRKSTSSNSPKKKGVSKVTYQRSASEETRSERDRRMYRECKGMHNAGACRGYTR